MRDISSMSRIDKCYTTETRYYNQFPKQIPNFAMNEYIKIKNEGKFIGAQINFEISKYS